MNGENKMKKLMFILVVCAFIAGSSWADLLTNGGAESGDLTGWTVDLTGASSGNTNIIAATTSQLEGGSSDPTVVNPHSGSYFFTFHNEATGSTSGSNDTISMSQTGTSGLGYSALTLEGWVQTYAPDPGEAILTFHDAGDVVIGAPVSTGDLDSHKAWSKFSISAPVPVVVDHWKVTLLGANEANTYANVFYDDVALVPVPGAILLGLLGLSAAGIKLRKFA